MNQDQLDFICSYFKPTEEFTWFLVEYRGLWLGGKIRQVTPALIELSSLQYVNPKDVPEWRDYENACRRTL